MKRFALSLLCAICGYLVSAVLGYFLIGQFSSNTHDLSVEAAMTSAFVFGPLGAVLAFVVAFILIGGTSRSTSPEG